jgi:hypothetical protein
MYGHRRISAARFYLRGTEEQRNREFSVPFVVANKPAPLVPGDLGAVPGRRGNNAHDNRRPMPDWLCGREFAPPASRDDSALILVNAAAAGAWFNPPVAMQEE